MIRKNPEGIYPRIHPSAYVDPSAVIIGDVVIGKNVYIGPFAVVRADEQRSAIRIGDECNVQDRVSIHALSGTRVVTGRQVSLAHGCIIHGPCSIGRGSFIGFGAVVYDAVIEDNVFVNHCAVVERRLLAEGSVIARSGTVRPRGRGKSAVAVRLAEFSRKVVASNIWLAKGYNK